MRAKIASGAVVAALAVTGTAVAAGGGGPVGGLFGDDRKQELASDLAERLDGVNPTEVEQALKAVGEAKMEEHRAAMAAAREAQMEERQAEALERLDEAVANGDISEEQADQIRERIETGPAHGGPGGPGGPSGPGGPGFGHGSGGPGGPGGHGFGPAGPGRPGFGGPGCPGFGPGPDGDPGADSSEGASAAAPDAESSAA